MQSEKPALLDMDLAQLKAFVTEHFGVPQYRAGQIYAWLMRGAGFHEMSNLPADLRQALAQRAVEG
ncbi:MAG: 23S rRNA (adenine(2503)-C(2))-methyltransferase RlmN, partial [Christensenellales bacterium]